MGQKLNRNKSRKSRKNKNKNRKSRKMRGGNTQYLSNVGYSSGYSLPFYKPYVTNIV